MKSVRKNIEGLHSIHFDRLADERGSLNRFFDRGEFSELGLGDWSWKLAVQSSTAIRNTLRGLHVQSPPFSEGKLILPLSGVMFWVCVDVRPASKTFGEWDSTQISAANRGGLLAESGFAHGCLSMTDDVNLMIFSDQSFREDMSAGIHWRDPDLGIDWPTGGEQPLISRGHDTYPSFAAFLVTMGFDRSTGGSRLNAN